MKTSFPLPALAVPRHRGVALIIVLSMLVLMSALLVAFMSSVSTERTSAAAATSGFEARQAADSAVNLAISQIRQATSQPAGTSWASSPGAIWTFESPKVGSVYKLYTSDEMQVNASAYKPENPEENGIDLTSERGVRPGFVDINEPVLVPIPSAAGSESATRYEAHYPIADPRAGLRLNGSEPVPGHGIVDGFYATKFENKQEKRDKDNNVIRLLPMPVKWLYQLKDGKIESADDKGEIASASKENPPISRIAFWTDDESAKVNVNTAAEGTFWDTPMASTFQESGVVNDGAFDLRANSKDLTRTLNLAAAQPARAEYQRFAGHPATTCLSPVMRWLFEDYDTDNDKTETSTASSGDKKFKEAIYELSPRYVGGTSSSVVASVNISEELTDYRNVKRDRLFSTLDEYFFRPDRTPLNLDGTSKVFDTGSNSHVGAKITQFTPDALEKLRFFLTANSRASELNMFGKPRMSIWPVSDVDDPNPILSKRTAFDDLIAFCSTFPSPPPNLPATTKKKAYYFQRAKSTDATYDYDRAGLGRNVDLYSYMQNMTSQRIPGLSSDFKTKYGVDERNQILTEMFDYIRSTNLVDTGGKEDPVTHLALPKNPYTPFYWSGASNSSAPVLGSGQVVPLEISSGGAKTTRGFGRFVTISEANLLFYYDNEPATIPGEIPVPVNTIPIRCVLLMEMVTPSIGYPALSENYIVKVTEALPVSKDIAAPILAAPFKYVRPDGTALNLNIAGGQLNYVNCDAYLGPHGRFFMPSRGFGNQFLMPSGGFSTTPKIFSKDGAAKSYPFYSRRIDIPTTPATPTFKITPGGFTIDIFAANNPAGIPLQRICIDFSAVDMSTLPLPTAAEIAFQSRIQLDLGPGRTGTDPNNPAYRRWIKATDVSRSMEVNGITKGDSRLVMASKFVGTDNFSAVPASAPNVNHAHTLHDGWGEKYANSRTEGFLVSGGKYRGDKRPDTPNSNTIVSGVTLKNSTDLGDFDRGISKHVDGPFINKADEGNIRFGPKENDDGRLPYYRGFGGYEEVDATFFSPNRLISSPVNFGSLPTGVFSQRPWETLVFRPQTGRRGSDVEPKDHYMLDLFQMPVVEPYAISEPMSVAGRVNLNCRIAPFGYLPDASAAKDSYGNPHYYMERSTGLHAVLKSQRMMVIPNDINNNAHEDGTTGGSTATKMLRYKIDRYRTIDTSIRKFLDANKYFRSASQICEIDLFPLSEIASPISVPDLTDPAARKNFWELQNGATGDNMRERPYSYIYPRLTTKSNVYTVHVWAQAISKSPSGNDAAQWRKFDEDRDRIVGEYRGSTTLERFLDPGDAALVDYDATSDGSESLDSYYRFRILNSKRFLIH